MKATAAASPFAALSPKEQKERWICWQCQHGAEAMPAPQPPAEDALPVTLPELKLPGMPEPEEAVIPPAPVIRHGQYDAVVRRMQQAQRRVAAYTPWTN